jgi:hypothetical protein
MHRAIMFNGIWVLAVTVSVFFFQGRQARRELDEQMNNEQGTVNMQMNRMILPSELLVKP